jgi:hypothetical protein
MVGEIVRLPLRAFVRAASLAVRGTEEMATLALRAVGVASRSDHSSEPPRQARERAKPATPRTGARATPVRRTTEPCVAQREPTHAPSQPPEPEPVHVSEEPALVEEFAEAGAEEGAGAQVTVDEPWKGYRRMTAQDVLDRIERASQAELAAIALYETANRHRRAILSEVERQLASGDAGGSRN